MATRAQQAKVGVFLLGSAILIAAGVLTMQGFNRESTSTYHIRFDESVLGLGIGGLVEYRGVPVGSIKHIYVADDNTARVEIEIVDNRVTLRQGVSAQIVMRSLATGQMAVSLQGGEGREPLEAGSNIPTRHSTLSSVSSQFETLLDSLAAIVTNLGTATQGMEEGQLTRIVEKVEVLLDDSHEFMASARDVIGSLEGGIDEAVSEYTQLAKDMRALAEDMRGVAETAEEFLAMATEKMEPLDLEKSQASLDRALENFAEMTEGLNETIERIDDVATAMLHETDNIEHSLREGIDSITEAFESLSELADSLNEDPSALLRGRGTPRER